MDLPASTTGSDRATAPVAPVVVVGAGMAGLTAAYLLHRAGVAVVVLDEAAQPGGMVRSRRQGEWLFEAGPHTISGLDAGVLDLLDEVGVGRLPVADPAGRRYLVHEGRPVAVPVTPGEMLASPLLSVAGRLRLLKESFVARGDHQDESVAGFARRRMGDEASRRFLEPVVAASTAGDPERLLARAVIGDLVDFERKAGSILKGRMRAARAARRESRQPPVGPWSTASGLAGVPHALAGRLGAAVRLDQSVVAVDWGGPGSGAAAPFTVRLASGELLAAAAVVLALPAPALARLAGSLPRAAGFAAFADLPHQDVAVVSLGYRRNAVTHPLDGFGIVAPPASGMAWRSVIFDSTLFAGRAPEGHVLLSAQVGGAGRAVAWADNDATLTARVHGELAGLLGIEGEPAVVAVDRWPQALPQMVAGHDAYLARAVATERDYPGVVLLGAWRDGLAVADVMRGGQCAAQRLHSVFDPVFPRLNPEV